jgi:hypothetical protein
MKDFSARKYFCLLFLLVNSPGFALDNKGGQLVQDLENGGALPKAESFKFKWQIK